MSTEAAFLSPVYNPNMQAFINEGEAINGASYQQLINEHGEDNTHVALFNLFNHVYVDDVKNQYSGSAIEDDVVQMLDEQLQTATQQTTSAAQSDVNEVYSDLMKFYAESRVEELNNDAQTPAGESSSSKSGSPGSSGNAVAGNASSELSGNWFAVLARAMGAAAGEHLKQAIVSGYKIADIAGRAEQDTQTAQGREANAQNAKDMAIEQANLQAQTQMFKMAYEATATLIKTTGESLSTMARKQ